MSKDEVVQLLKNKRSWRYVVAGGELDTLFLMAESVNVNNLDYNLLETLIRNLKLYAKFGLITDDIIERVLVLKKVIWQATGVSTATFPTTFRTWGDIVIPPHLEVRLEGLVNNLHDIFRVKGRYKFRDTYHLLREVLPGVDYGVTTTFIRLFDGIEGLNKKFFAMSKDGNSLPPKGLVQILLLFCDEVSVKNLPEVVREKLVDKVITSGFWRTDIRRKIYVFKDGMTEELIKAVVLRAINTFPNKLKSLSSEVTRAKKYAPSTVYRFLPEDLQQIVETYLEADLVTQLRNMREVAKMRLTIVLSLFDDLLKDIVPRLDFLDSVESLYHELILEPIKKGYRITLEMSLGELLMRVHPRHPVSFTHLYGGDKALLNEQNAAGIHKLVAAILDESKVIEGFEGSVSESIKSLAMRLKGMDFSSKSSTNSTLGNADVVGKVIVGKEVAEIQVKIIIHGEAERLNHHWRVIKDFLKSLIREGKEKMMVTVVAKESAREYAEGIIEVENELLTHLMFWKDGNNGLINFTRDFARKFTTLGDSLEFFMVGSTFKKDRADKVIDALLILSEEEKLMELGLMSIIQSLIKDLTNVNALDIMTFTKDVIRLYSGILFFDSPYSVGSDT